MKSDGKYTLATSRFCFLFNEEPGGSSVTTTGATCPSRSAVVRVSLLRGVTVRNAGTVVGVAFLAPDDTDEDDGTGGAAIEAGRCVDIFLVTSNITPVLGGGVICGGVAPLLGGGDICGGLGGGDINGPPKEARRFLRGGVCGSRTATHGAAYAIAGRRNTLKAGDLNLLGIVNPPATLLVVRLKATCGMIG